MTLSATEDVNDLTWAEGLTRCKRALLINALTATGGNRTHAARRLGLQRTYFLRLLREFNAAGVTPRRPQPSSWIR